MPSDEKLYLLHLPQSSIDRNITSRPSESLKGINAIADDLSTQPLISSKCPGHWHSIGTRTLTPEQAEREVGYLHKNTTPEQRASLAGLTGADTVCPLLRNPAYLDHVRKTRIERGLDRVSRMRSDYKPVSETNKL